MKPTSVYYAKTLDRERVQGMCALIQGYFRQAGLDLEIDKYVATRLGRMMKADNPVYQYEPVYNQFSEPGKNIFFFVHPYHETVNSVAHRGGSYICGRYGVHSFAPNNKESPNSYEMTLFGALHEFGHLYGARHTTGKSIMNRDPIGTAFKNNWTLLFAEKSIQEMKACTGKL